MIIQYLYIFLLNRWCQGEPNNKDFSRNWKFNLKWTYEGCVAVKSGFGSSICLNDIPCRAGETDGLFKTSSNYILCQYPYDQSSPKPLINLPQAWNTLEDDFFLHENEFLLSTNQKYQFYLKKGNLLIINVIISNKK